MSLMTAQLPARRWIDATLLVGALTVVTVGCAESTTKLPPAAVRGGETASQANASEDARQTASQAAPAGTEGTIPNLDVTALLNEMVETYRNANTYQDAGELHIDVVYQGGEKESSGAIPFSVAFERPNKIRVHSLAASVVADGQLLRASVNALEGQVLQKPDPETLSLGAIEADTMLTQAMRGNVGVAQPQLELLLSEDPLAKIGGGAAPKLLADAEFLGEMCHRVAYPGENGSSVLWISPATKLLVKFEFPVDAFAQKHSLAEARIEADFKGAKVGAQIAADAFKFDVPEGSKLLTRFLPAPPDAPSPMLGQKVGDFSFVDAQGESVSPQSLTGKIVVLDLWATWCGWCFEGFPNLQKVYDQYKDNDKVAILAVNTDDVTVSDEKVRASFAKARLTIPIVRDSKRMADAAFQIQGLPTMIILGADGAVEEYHIGFDANLATTLPAKLEELLAGKSLAKQEREKYEQELAEYQKQESEALVAGATGSEP
ncbi:MAG: redoxin domain-containing protein [Pirellulales bacterium]